MKKDDAQRRAEALVTITGGEFSPDSYCSVHVGGKCIAGAIKRFQADDMVPAVREAIASTIRAAVAAEREANDRIMTDLLGKTEAECEMWRQGAEAMRELAARLIGADGSHRSVYWLFRMEELAIPQPPSQTGTGEVLRPSRIALERERYRKALEEIGCITRWDHNTSMLQDMIDIQQVAREALEDTNEDT